MPLSFFHFLSIFYLSINLITTDHPKVKSPDKRNNHLTCQIYEFCAIFFVGRKHLIDFWSRNKPAVVLISLVQVAFVCFLDLTPGHHEGSCAAEVVSMLYNPTGLSTCL